MILLGAVWILGLQLEYGGETYTGFYPIEKQCTDTGERLHRAAVERAKKHKRRPPPGLDLRRGRRRDGAHMRGERIQFQALRPVMLQVPTARQARTLLQRQRGLRGWVCWQLARALDRLGAQLMWYEGTVEVITFSAEDFATRMFEAQSGYAEALQRNPKELIIGSRTFDELLQHGSRRDSLEFQFVIEYYQRRTITELPVRIVPYAEGWVLL